MSIHPFVQNAMNTLQLPSSEESIIIKCISTYSKSNPGLFKTLNRIWQAVLYIFGFSNWQKARNTLSSHAIKEISKDLIDKINLGVLESKLKNYNLTDKEIQTKLNQVKEIISLLNNPKFCQMNNKISDTLIQSYVDLNDQNPPLTSSPEKVMTNIYEKHKLQQQSDTIMMEIASHLNNVHLEITKLFNSISPSHQIVGRSRLAAYPPASKPPSQMIPTSSNEPYNSSACKSAKLETTNKPYFLRV